MIFQQSTLLRRGLLIILLPVVSLAVLFLVLIAEQRRHQEAQEKAVHTKEVLQSLDAVFEALLLRQVELRGRLFGLPGELKPGEATDAGVRAQLAALTAKVADNPAQRDRMRALTQTAERRLQWEAELYGALSAGKRDAALAQFQTRFGSELMATIRGQVAALRDEETRLDRLRLAELRAATRSQNLLVIAGLVLTVGAAGLAMQLYSRGIAHRVQLLTEDVERLKRGEALAAPPAGGDELAKLRASFHAMATALAEARQRDHASQQLIERRNGELTRANHELAQKNRENEMFVYSVSHDLRSPLVNLQGFSRELAMARDDLRTLFAGPLSEADRTRGHELIARDMSESIRYIQTAVLRLSTIIDALLRLSRAGRVEYQPQPVPLTPVVERIVAAMRDSITARGATVQLQEPLPAAWGDATALEQILANLIGNAVNYLDPARPGVIEIGVLPTDNAGGTTCFVRDNGLGIAAAYLPKVFAAFQRLHEKMAPGEGIGLALVRRAVERHGGRIWVESQEGIGSTFFVALPAEENSPLKHVPKKESLTFRASQNRPSPTPAPSHVR